MSRAVAAGLSCLIERWTTGGAGVAGVEVLAVERGSIAGDCDDVVETIGADVSATFRSGEPEREYCAQPIAISAAAATAPTPTRAAFLIRFRDMLFDCSIAFATDALNETEAGYDGPLNLDRTVVNSFAMSSAFVYRCDGSFAIAFWTIRSSDGGSPGISSLIGRGFSVMILKNRF